MPLLPDGGPEPPHLGEDLLRGGCGRLSGGGAAEPRGQRRRRDAPCCDAAYCAALSTAAAKRGNRTGSPALLGKF